jgi:all-trans-retinol dehydrogenase (NAD+)
MSEIAGRNVLITGAASGIGRRMAREIAALGGRMVLWDIDSDRLEKVLAELKEDGGYTAHGFRCDVSRRQEVYRRAEESRSAVGPIDILINNAGVVSGRSLLELPDEKIEATFAVNTLALFWTTKAFLPEMVERGSGHIVTIASASGLMGVAKLSDYSASKWAAMGFDESLRAELAQSAPGVKTTVVCPYYIDTGMFRGVKSRFPLLMPILKEESVAHRVVKAILRDQRRIALPRTVHWIPLLRLLPLRLFDALAGLLGVNVSMQEFVGREGERQADG